MKLEGQKIVIKEASEAEFQKLVEEGAHFHDQINEREMIAGRTVFIAKKGPLIVGYIVALAKTNRRGELISFSTRKGFEHRGVGSKLLGRANAFFIKHNTQLVEVYSAIDAIDFYKLHTNYKQVKCQRIAFFWKPQKTPQRKWGEKPTKVRPTRVLVPQNLLRPDARLRRRAGKR